MKNEQIKGRRLFEVSIFSINFLLVTKFAVHVFMSFCPRFTSFKQHEMKESLIFKVLDFRPHEIIFVPNLTGYLVWILAYFACKIVSQSENLATPTLTTIT